MTCNGRTIQCAGAFAVVCAVAASGAASAGVISLGASHDATLYESASGLIANGAGQYLFAGRNNQSPSGLIRRGLIRFDVAGTVPEGAEITSVRLILNLSQLNGGPASVSLHRSLTGWTAGASDPPGNEGSGAPPLSGDATWLHSSFQTGGGTLWSAPGGDFTSTASASVLTTGVGLHTWTSDALLADVRSFAASPASNFGWFLVGPEALGGVTRRFDSAESASAGGIVPRLEIEWTVIPAPGVLAVAGVAGTLGARRRRSGNRTPHREQECEVLPVDLPIRHDVPEDGIRQAP